MKHEGRYPAMVGLKLPADLAKALRREASADDRTVSSYLRRLIAAAVQSAPAQRKGEGQ